MLFAAELRTGLHVLDYVAVALYLVLTVAIVVWASRRGQDTEDFFLGGRSMPWLAVGLSIMATLLSSITYLGMPGEIVKNGVAILAMQVAIFPVMVIVLWVLIPFFMRLRLTSAYEYLERRFDYRARLMGGVLFFLLRLGWVSVVMYTGSLAIAEMAGWKDGTGLKSLNSVILVMGVAATLYTCFGGLKAVIWTDVVQAVMLFGGAAAIVGYVWLQTGYGPAEWWAEAARGSVTRPKLEWFSFDPRVRMTVGTAFLGGLFWQLCTHSSDQVVLQRYASTPSIAAARKSYLTNMASAFGIAILLGLSGLALVYFYTKNPDRLAAGLTPTSKGDALMPYFYSHELPIGFAGLILANFLCDAMQTLVSGVNSTSAVASEDVIERLRSTPTTEAHRLRTAQLLTLLLGGLCTAFGLGAAEIARATGKNIVDLMPYFNMFLGPLGCLFLIGLFLPRVTGRLALTVILATVGLAIFWTCWGSTTGLLLHKGVNLLMASDLTSLQRLVLDATSKAAIAQAMPRDLSPILAVAAPCVCGFLLAAILSLPFGTAAEHPGRQFTWWAVMRRPYEEPAGAREPVLPTETGGAAEPAVEPSS